MTISSTTRVAGPYQGNNVTVVYPFTFKVFGQSDVEVIHTEDSIETVLELATHYTVSLNADQDSAPGGSVTILTTPTSQQYITITSKVQELQALDVTNGGGFFPDIINTALDKLTVLIQQVKNSADRSVKVPISSTVDPDDLIASVTASEASAAASAATAVAAAVAAEAAVPSGALGFTPVNITGDTMTGNLLLPGINVNGSGLITSLGNAATKTTGTASGNVPLVSNIVGTQTIWIPAGAMTPRTTNGAAVGTAETATNKVMIKTLDFDPAADEFAQFSVLIPKSFDAAYDPLFTAQFVWSHPATTTNFGVNWGIQAKGLSDNEAIDAAFGTAVYASDTGGTTDYIYKSGQITTLDASGAKEDWITFQVTRRATFVNDTLAVDARLHGVVLTYNTDALNDN